MTDFQNLSAEELQAVINNAEKALKNQLVNKRKDVIAEIKRLAASIEVNIDIQETEKKSTRKGTKAAIKYRHPDDAEKTWTGRGVMPRWLRALLDAGHSKSEFEV
jgi:DNA-binding protein H-NS